MTDKSKEYEKVICNHCEGEGCCFCDTLGYVFVEHPPRMCRHCNGIGCLYCGYTGWSNL